MPCRSTGVLALRPRLHSGRDSRQGSGLETHSLVSGAVFGGSLVFLCGFGLGSECTPSPPKGAPRCRWAVHARAA